MVRQMTVEERLISLEYEIRRAEDRIRTEIIKRDVAWLDRFSTAMMLLARMIVEASSAPQQQGDHASAAADHR